MSLSVDQGNDDGQMELLPHELVGYILGFLDGRSLTSFEFVSASTRRLLLEHPDMFKRLLVSTVCAAFPAFSLRDIGEHFE